ncbi:MAG TPA: phosphate ABC transporter substrate-binding protein [Thermoanaerobaculaceae bacterium]|nr:phosphate ABC transporter substrate-binding protein [Thermoanaerobaculaceae bacterium]
MNRPPFAYALSSLGACRRNRKARVTGAVGPDARRRTEGDAGSSEWCDNAADGPTPHAPGKPPARGPSHFSDRLLGVGLAVGALGLLLAACGRSGDGTGRTTIQVRGSDTMVNVAQAWAEEYQKVESKVGIEVSGGGSGVGIAALEKGTIDIANASRNMKPEEIEQATRNTGKAPKEFIVGFDGLAIYVNRDNPLSEITIGQLAEVFGEGGKATRWADLGVTIPGVTDDTIVRVSRQSSSGTYEFFREHILGTKDFKLGSRDMNGSKEVVELVGNTRTAIGYSGMAYTMPTVKMLKLARRTSEPAYEPNVANTVSRAYPLARSLQIYTLGEPQGEVKKYIDWILSPAGQRILEETGYVPVGQPAK